MDLTQYHPKPSKNTWVMLKTRITVRKFGAMLLAVMSSFHLSIVSANDIETFSTLGKVKLLMTGNTLGLSGEHNSNGPGTEGSIHTFTALSEGLVDDVPLNPTNPWPSFTTFDFHSNGSRSDLNIPDGATVVYAELIWGGSYRYVEDVEAALDSNVQFSTPRIIDLAVTPSSLTPRTLDFLGSEGFQVAYYIRSSEVTELVAQGGSGFYAVSGVPGTQHESNNSLNAAGWALIVVVTHPDFDCRSTQLKIVGDWVDETNPSDIVFTGLKSRDAAPVAGKLLVGAIEGDANSLGDGMAIQSSLSQEFIPLSTPNNPVYNFFGSQINDIAGLLDISGTWGTVNHDAISGQNFPGARQGWDITGVELSSDSNQLMPAQQQVSFRAATTGDSLLLVFMAFEVDADGCPFIFSDGFELMQ